MNAPVIFAARPSEPMDPGSDELQRVYQLQRAAFVPGDGPPLQARLASLQRLKRMVVENRDAIVAAISADFGARSPTETDLLEIGPTLSAIKYASKRLRRWMAPQRRHVDLMFQPAKAWVQHQPLGVVGVISPWNYPLLLALSPLNDALAAGNKVMLKPSELTPAFWSLLQSLIASAFDEAEVAVVTGGPDVAEAFSGLPFDHLVFTGSTAIGRKVMVAAARNMTPVTLELGGKSPCVICPDYPLEKAARAIAFGKFINAGQTCIAPDYVLVPADKADALAQAVLNQAHAYYPKVAGNPDYSAIISQRHFDRLTTAVAAAAQAGARVLCNAEPAAAAERKIAPTLVISPPVDSLLMQEEIFGPVLPIVPYASLEEAIAYINAGDRPLALYCLGREAGARNRVLSGTISGGVTLNGTLLHIAQESLPFGGVGASGIGAYHGVEGFRRFSHARAVHQVGAINAFERLAPPYGKLAKAIARQLIKS